MSDVTRILAAIDAGDACAAEELLPLVYDELRRLAAQKLSHEPAGITLQPTALVHEAYMKLAGSVKQDWNSKGHFFAAAAESMRRILIDEARRRGRVKRGGGLRKIDLDNVDLAQAASSDDLLALNEALDKLTEEDAAKGELVRLRYFAGLSLEQTAEMLGISRATASRYWTYARAWLYDEIRKGDEAR